MLFSNSSYCCYALLRLRKLDEVVVVVEKMVELRFTLDTVMPVIMKMMEEK